MGLGFGIALVVLLVLVPMQGLVLGLVGISVSGIVGVGIVRVEGSV